MVDETYTAFLAKKGREAEGRITGPHPFLDGKPAPAIRESYIGSDGRRRVATYELSETVGGPSLYEYTWVSDEQVADERVGGDA
jgi:hypothetical protein